MAYLPDATFPFRRTDESSRPVALNTTEVEKIPHKKLILNVGYVVTPRSAYHVMKTYLGSVSKISAVSSVPSLFFSSSDMAARRF